jgi:hypothetical protein
MQESNSPNYQIPELTENDLWEGNIHTMPEQTPSGAEQTPQETPEQKYARLYSQQQQPAQVQQQAQVVQPDPNAALVAEIAQLKASFAQQLDEFKASMPKPQATPAPVVGDPGWVDLIRQGNFEGAEKALIARTRETLKQELQGQAYQEALIATNIQLEIKDYTNKVRAENPDIIPLEPYLQAPINARVEAAKASGRIKSNEDFVREYKLAVDEEVKKLRNITLQYRADGKTEAQVRQQVVLGSLPLTPQATSIRGEGSTQTELQSETATDYFARRKADEARRHGMA